MMKKSCMYIVAVAFLSCTNVDSAEQKLMLPNPLGSIELVKAELKNKHYKVQDAGTIDLFNEYDWSISSADTTKFYKDYMAERKAFSFHFTSDTSVNVTDEGKQFEASYVFEKDTSKTVLLQLHYVDSSFCFNPGEPVIVTSTYKIRGLDNNGLLLETPREINRKKIMLLMKNK